MKKQIPIFYGLLWLVYIAFCYAAFPLWSNHVTIPAFALVGFAGFVFGTTCGYLSIIALTINHYILCNIAYPESNVYYEDRAIGIVITIAVVWLSSTLKKNLDELRDATTILETTIKKRNQELNLLANQLIEQTELRRIELGEALHDGIGQELTGIHLYCGALMEQLDAEQSPNSSLACSLRHRASTAHNLIRVASRTLFPVKLGEIGLPSALDELASCLKDTKHIGFYITGHEILHDLPPPLALELYRICQESALYILNNSNAGNIIIFVSREDRNLYIKVRHDGTHIEPERQKDLDASIIKYRLKKIAGEVRASSTPTEEQQLIYSIPEPT